MSRSAKLGEQKSQQVEGGTILYRERGNGSPVVFVHGLLVNGDLWRKVVPAVAADARCITPDLPLGSHDEPFERRADLTPPALARTIVEFMDALGLEDVTLVANDTGGAISQMLVADNPGRVSRLVLTPCDVGRNFLPPRFRYLQYMSRIPGALRLVSASVRIGAVRNGPLGFGGLAKHGIDDVAMASYLEPAQADRKVLRDARKVLRGIDTKDSLSALSRLGDFAGPALVAWADTRKVFPRKDAKKLAAALRDARVELIEDSYAFVPEDQPERLAELIREFIAA